MKPVDVEEIGVDKDKVRLEVGKTGMNIIYFPFDIDLMSGSLKFFRECKSFSFYLIDTIDNHKCIWINRSHNLV